MIPGFITPRPGHKAELKQVAPGIFCLINAYEGEYSYFSKKPLHEDEAEEPVGVKPASKVQIALKPAIVTR